MPIAETNGSFVATQRRHPRLLRAVRWMRSHPVLCGTLGTAGIAAVFVVDMSAPGYLMNGLYIIPLFFLALAVDERAVAFAVAVCVALSFFVFFWEGAVNVDHWLILLYLVMIGGALVILSYLIKRLSTITAYSVLRAQLSEAGADILGSGRSRDDLDELLEYALERLGEQLDATSGVLLLLEDGNWVGRAGFGLGVDAREVVALYRGGRARLAGAARRRVPLPGFHRRRPRAAGAARGAYARLERVLRAAHARARSRGRRHGLQPAAGRPATTAASRWRWPRASPAMWASRSTTCASCTSSNTRRRDLELVRDSSLDFAQSIDMDDVLEAVVTRLVRAARHARLRHLRGGSRGRRDAKPDELRRRRLRRGRVDGQASSGWTSSPRARWRSAAAVR